MYVDDKLLGELPPGAFDAEMKQCLLQAESIEEAVRIAQEFPWVRYGCIEVRPVRDVQIVRKRVGA